MRKFLITACVSALVAGCAPKPPPNDATPEPPLEMPGLHNIHRVSDKLISGSSPDGDAGFHSLQELGAHTIISVDGARPDVERAHRFGLRYVHLPIGYDGVPRQQMLRIARAIRDLPGRVYIHCHHGKHRGPAAAVSAQRCLDNRCSVATALEFLHQAGTDPHYRGLYSSAEQSGFVDPRELDAVPADFPEVAETAGLVHAMVAIDQHWDNMKSVRSAHWAVPPNHADIDPTHEALQLREQFREALRLAEVQRKPDAFRRLLTDAESACADLESSLRGPQEPAKAETAYVRCQETCNRCHQQFRDADNSK
jgi:protein tyrosine phosphatase (PTP) superfamily phosphohydrolase (DUF442 family)